MDIDVTFSRLKECFINNKCVNTLATNFNVLRSPTEKIIRELMEEYSSILEEEIEDDMELQQAIDELLSLKTTSLLRQWFPFIQTLEDSSGSGVGRVINKLRSQVEEILKKELGLEY